MRKLACMVEVSLLHHQNFVRTCPILSYSKLKLCAGTEYHDDQNPQPNSVTYTEHKHLKARQNMRWHVWGPVQIFRGGTSARSTMR